MCFRFSCQNSIYAAANQYGRDDATAKHGQIRFGTRESTIFKFINFTSHIYYELLLRNKIFLSPFVTFLNCQLAVIF